VVENRDFMPKKRSLEQISRNFGTRLRAARVMAGYNTAEDFARDLGVQYARYTKNERGESIPRADVLIHICELLDVTTDYLLRGIPDRKRH